MKFQNSLLLSLIYFCYVIVGFPLFYFVYRYGDPEPASHDFFQYYHLYLRMETDLVIAPHNMRLVGAFFVNMLYKLNIYYDTACVFDKYDSWGFLKQVYFCAILFNFLCVAATCLVLFEIARSVWNDVVLAFGTGLLFLLGFGTLFYCITPLTESFSILVFTVFLYWYRTKNMLVLIPIVILIFQREYLLVTICTLAIFDFFFRKTIFYLETSVASCLAFGVHFFLRKTIFFSYHLESQIDPTVMFQNILMINFKTSEYIRQLTLPQNLLIVYLLVLTYKYINGLQIIKRYFFLILILFLQVNFISISGGHGNNVGRYFYLSVPIVILALMSELTPLLFGSVSKIKADIF